MSILNEDDVTLVINRDENGIQTTKTYTADSIDELSRMLSLAGVSNEDDDNGVEVIDVTRAPEEQFYNKNDDVSDEEGALEIANGGEVEVHDGEIDISTMRDKIQQALGIEIDTDDDCCGGNCSCEGGCHPGCGCGCSVDTGMQEGWLENQTTTGAAEYEGGDPNDVIEIDFDTDTTNLGESDEHASEDYGHQDYTDRVPGAGVVRGFDYKGRAEGGGSNKFRYTKAGMADNPMTMEDGDDFDAEIDNETVDAELDAMANALYTRIENGGDNVDGILAELDSALDPQDVKDQFLALYNVTPEDMIMHMRGQNMGESISRSGESIAILLENTTDTFMEALNKVRENKVSDLNDQEISNLAAAFINIMRETDTSRVTRLHECMMNFVGNSYESDYEDAYKQWIKNQ